jgi:DNA replication protein DnaC
METNTTTTEPQPAFAFSVFAASRPVLQQIAQLTGTDLSRMERPWLSIEISIHRLLDRLPSPPRIGVSYRPDRPEFAPLFKMLEDPSLGREEKQNIERRILALRDELNRPEREHSEKIERLKKESLEEVAAFHEWIKTDPAGIAAAAQDKAFREWTEAERNRKAEQEREERWRKKVERERYELREIIGHNLTTLDLDHPDIDRAAVEKFLAWCNRYEDENGGLFIPTNAILSGPSGTGKTRAMAQAALWHCEECIFESVEWITGYEFAELVGNLATDRRADANDRLREITEAPILFFDDLGSANFTTARTSRFFRLVDERHRNDRATIISTNYSTSQLKKLFATTGETKEEAVRILRRIIGTPASPLASFFHFKRVEAKR